MSKISTALLFIICFISFNTLAQKPDAGNKLTVLIAPKYELVKDFSEGLAAVKLNGKWGFVDKQGNEVIAPKYKDAGLFSEGIVAVKMSDKWGYIDHKGNTVIPFNYKAAKDFKDGVAAVNLNGFWGGINKAGKEVISFKYDAVNSMSEGLAVVVEGVYEKDGGQIYLVEEKHAFVNALGKEVISMFEREIGDFSEDLAAVKDNGKWGYIDRNKKIGGVPVKYDSALVFSGDRAAVKLKGRWGYIDHAGKEVIALNYSYAATFTEGLASVSMNGKWGFIDPTGKVIVPIEYDSTARFSEDLALVMKGGKIGYINKDYKEVIPMKYEAARSFSDGAAAVKLNGKWGFVTIAAKKPHYIHGKLMTMKDGKPMPLANAKVKLSNSLDTVVTNKDGFFKIFATGFKHDVTIGVVVNSEVKNVTLYTVDNEKIGDLSETATNTFEYHFLPMDMGKLKVPEEEEVEIAFKGRLLTDTKGKKVPLTGAVVKFAGSEDSTTTDVNGDFELTTTNKVKEETLVVTAPKKTENVIVANQQGEEIAPMKLINNTSFEYRFLPNEFAKMTIQEEEEVTPQFRGKILTEKSGKKIPVSNATVQLSNSSETAITDEFGDFKLNADGYKDGVTLKVKTEENLGSVILATQHGEEITKMVSVGNNTFEYKLLPMEYGKMTTMKEEDVEMAFKKADKSGDLNISQQIHYAFGKYELEASSYEVLDKIVKIMNENPKVKLEIISHTDAIGGTSYNMMLSKQRAETVMNYLIASGVKKSRLTATGKGESEIRNRCTDGVECSDLEHEYNRHTEFRFIWE